MVSNPLFLPFNFYNALFGNLGVVCLDFGLCLQALRIFVFTWLLIWTVDLCDLGLHIIGYRYWAYLNLFDFADWVFLSVWTGVLALC